MNGHTAPEGLAQVDYHTLSVDTLDVNDTRLWAIHYGIHPDGKSHQELIELIKLAFTPASPL